MAGQWVLDLGLLSNGSNNWLSGLDYDDLVRNLSLSVMDAEEKHLLRERLAFYFGVAGMTICLLGLIGNILSFTVLSRRAMRSSTYSYLSALSVTDSLMLICTMVLLIHDLNIPGTSTQLQHHRSFWKDRLYPRLFPYLHPVAITFQVCSVWLTLAFTVDRYIMICHPFRAEPFCTISRARKVITALVLASFAYNIPKYFEYRTITIALPNNNTRVYNDLTELGRNPRFKTLYHFYLYVFFVVGVPLLSLGVLNSFLLHSVRLSRKRGREINADDKKRNDTTVMLIGTVVIFLFCQVPGDQNGHNQPPLRPPQSCAIVAVEYSEEPKRTRDSQLWDETAATISESERADSDVIDLSSATKEPIIDSIDSATESTGVTFDRDHLYMKETVDTSHTPLQPEESQGDLCNMLSVSSEAEIATNHTTREDGARTSPLPRHSMLTTPVTHDVIKADGSDTPPAVLGEVKQLMAQVQTYSKQVADMRKQACALAEKLQNSGGSQELSTGVLDAIMEQINSISTPLLVSEAQVSLQPVATACHTSWEPSNQHTPLSLVVAADSDPIIEEAPAPKYRRIAPAASGPNSPSEVPLSLADLPRLRRGPKPRQQSIPQRQQRPNMETETNSASTGSITPRQAGLAAEERSTEAKPNHTSSRILNQSEGKTSLTREISSSGHDPSPTGKPIDASTLAAMATGASPQPSAAMATAPAASDSHFSEVMAKGTEVFTPANGASSQIKSPTASVIAIAQSVVTEAPASAAVSIIENTVDKDQLSSAAKATTVSRGQLGCAKSRRTQSARKAGDDNAAAGAVGSALTLAPRTRRKSVAESRKKSSKETTVTSSPLHRSPVISPVGSNARRTTSASKVASPRSTATKMTVTSRLTAPRASQSVDALLVKKEERRPVTSPAASKPLPVAPSAFKPRLDYVIDGGQNVAPGKGASAAETRASLDNLFTEIFNCGEDTKKAGESPRRSARPRRGMPSPDIHLPQVDGATDSPSASPSRSKRTPSPASPRPKRIKLATSTPAKDARTSHSRVLVLCRPWRTPEGTMNRQVLKMMLTTLLTRLMMQPGMTLRNLSLQLLPVLQPVCVTELVEILEELGCVKKHNLVVSGQSSLFSSRQTISKTEDNSVTSLDTVLIPTVDCVIKMGQFEAQLQGLEC